jgi:hypothetical protein
MLQRLRSTASCLHGLPMSSRTARGLETLHPLHTCVSASCQAKCNGGGGTRDGVFGWCAVVRGNL